MPSFLAGYGQAMASGIPAKTRIAPTPSGYIHLGNAYNFVLNWMLARYHPNGKILLRIDDLDNDRKRPEFVEDIFYSLDWLGLDWDEGPFSVAGFEAEWSQSLRLPRYESALASLRQAGHLFPCALSRKDLAEWNGDYPLSGREQAISFDRPNTAWRIKTPRPFPLPDFVVRRRDGIPAYQIASVCDDLAFSISHVVRGEDLRASTEAQVFLAGLMAHGGSFGALNFLHHPLLQGDDGTKLSKSAGATALKHIREKHTDPAWVYRSAAVWLGLGSVKVEKATDLLSEFADFSAGHL